MNLIREFMLILILTTAVGSLLMFLCLTAIYAGMGKRNIRLAWWTFRGVLVGHLVPFVCLPVHWCLENIKNCHDVLSISTPQIDKVFLIFFVIWAAGIFAIMLYQIRTWIGFRRIKKGSMIAPMQYCQVLEKLCGELNIKKQISLYCGYGVVSPFILGVKNPGIYLPVRRFSAEELEMVLYHELVHYKQRDTFWKPLFGLFGNIYWFNPLSRRFWNESVCWTEANCDSYCYRERFQPKKYFSLLLEMADAPQNSLNGYAPMWAEGNRELKWRLLCMKKNQVKKVSGKVIAAIMIFSISCGGVSAYAATEGMRQVYYQAYDKTTEWVEEPADDWNELPEYEGSVEDFAGTEIVEHTSEEQTNVRSKSGNFEWTVNNNTTHYTGGLNVSAGEEISVTVGVEPSDRSVRVGILKPDGKTSYVTGKNMITKTFQITKTGTYKVFVMNKSGRKVSISGFYMIR